MDKKINVLNSYNVFVGTQILNKIPELIDLKKYSGIFLIIDSAIEKNWSQKIKEAFPQIIGKIVLQGGDSYKNIETVQKVWQEFISCNCDRKTLVVNVGGGVIGDLGGFAASTYMRGLDFIQIPTTLIAQVDSSVGGKVGINFNGIKNLIGSFNQPTAVICDIELLTTLKDREFISGFAEIIKHGLITDKSYFDFVTSKKPKDFNNEELKKIISTSVEIKANIVSEDEKESAIRKLLNFGHTIGHAIEVLSLETKNPLLHGESIGIGMLIEAKISQLLEMISKKEFLIIEDSIKNAGLPASYLNLSINGQIPSLQTKIMDKIKGDKKMEKGKINWTLIKGIGRAVINQNVNDKIVISALQKYGFTD